MSTRVSTPLPAITSVASSPSISGIRMSMSTTSGRSRRTSSTASCPFAASPTTSMSSHERSSTTKPLRTSAWSSATATRITRPLRMAGVRPRGCRRPSAVPSTIVISIVVLITVFASSTRASLNSTIDTAMKGNYIVRTQFGMGGMSTDVAQRIDALPETSAVTPLRYASAKSNGATKDVTGLDPATVEQTVYTDVQQGSLEHLGLHDVGVLDKEAENRGLAIGDTVTLDFPETGAQAMRVVAVYGTDIPLGKYAISLEAFDANVAKHVDDDVVVAV